MTTYATRVATAKPWEETLVLVLKEKGWLAAPFGQAQITEDLRENLRAWSDDYGNPTLLRWMPDIIAARPGPDPYICLIDAKTESASNQASPNYSIEVNAVDAGLVFANFLRIPVLYVWSDGGVMTPNTVLNRWSSKQDGSRTNGSKTAFYLVRKAFARKAADVFPTIPRAG